MTADRVTLPVPAHALPHRTPLELLTSARTTLDEAATIHTPGMRFATAHLAALRAAAAVMAVRVRASRPSMHAKLPPVWEQLPLVAPELAEWAQHFASTATKRAAAEAGIPRTVTVAEADGMVRTAGQFVAVVEVMLGGAR
ncbi:SAV_6107 family HEPN domain-containing protein [Dactylosporangium sp. NPDC000244]|uniref:SAV_6107 family HEPN domain-containing protein n=1 Tax=Dactylosporangium sp. NPDC000244 TaxID=3154365 RepID=UPI003322C909